MSPAPESRTVQLPAGPVSYWIAGRGAPLLYLHGAGGFRFSPGLAALCRSVRLFAPVLPGFDGTPALPGVDSMRGLADLAAAFHQAVIGAPCDAGGHSLGGRAALWLALLHPERVRRLVVVAPSGLPVDVASPRPPGREPPLHLHPERLGPAKAPDLQAANQSAAARYRGPGNADPELAARLGDIRTLALVLHGTADGRVPVEAMRLLRRRIPAAHLCYVDEAAHGVDVDQPERFAAVVGDFLAEGEAFLVNWQGDDDRDAPPVRPG